MEHKFMDIIFIDCISYTILSIIISILAFIPSLAMPINHITCLSLFLVTTLISILIVMTSNIDIESFWVENILYIIEVCIIVYSIGGGIFHWFPLELYYLIEAGMICIIVYITTSVIIYWYFHLLAKKINRKIEEHSHENYRS